VSAETDIAHMMREGVPRQVETLVKAIGDRCMGDAVEFTDWQVVESTQYLHPDGMLRFKIDMSCRVDVHQSEYQHPGRMALPDEPGPEMSVSGIVHDRDGMWRGRMDDLRTREATARAEMQKDHAESLEKAVAGYREQLEVDEGVQLARRLKMKMALKRKADFGEVMDYFLNWALESGVEFTVNGSRANPAVVTRLFLEETGRV